MRPLLAALALAAAEARAEERLAWGVPATEAGPSVVELRRCAPDEGCFARVLFLNTLVDGRPDLVAHPLDMGGFVVLVSVLIQGHTIPDEMAVTPPPGFRAIPARIDAEEGATVEVLIVADALS